MTEEKYVKEIVRRVKCSGKKRREIKQQLLSDLSAAKEAGEDFRERMASVKDAAAEFNDNLSQEEQKRYKRKRLVVIIGILVLVLAVLAILAWWFLPKSFPFGTSGKFEQKEVTARLKEVIQNVDEEDSQALLEQCTKAMKRALTPEVLKNAKAAVSDHWGAFQSWGKIYMAEVVQQGKTLVLCQVSVVYENVSVTYTISFDEDMKLAGLYLK